MTDLRTAAQQALEAMEKATRFMSDKDYRKLNETIEALRAALAEPPYHQYPLLADRMRIDPVTGDVSIGTPQRKPRHISYVCPQCHWSLDERNPLTDEEIDELAMDKDGLPNSHIEFARAIEQAHGIGEHQ